MRRTIVWSMILPLVFLSSLLWVSTLIADDNTVTFVTIKKTVNWDDKVTFSVKPGQRYLFVDDHDVVEMKNLTRTMHKPEKKGAVIVPEEPSERFVQSWSTPEWIADKQCFKLWLYSSMTSGVGIGCIESKDGITWTRPVVREIEINGSLENNIFTKDTFYNAIYDPDDSNPSRRYKGLLLISHSERVNSTDGVNWSREKESGAPLPNLDNYYLSYILDMSYDPKSSDPTRRYTGIGYYYTRQPMVSSDGIHWQKLDVPGIPTADEGLLTYDRETKTYIATVKQGELGPYGRSVALSTSKDFEHWTKPELIFHCDDEDGELAVKNIKARIANPDMQRQEYNDPEQYFADVYNMRIINYEGIYIGFPSFFHHTGLNQQKINWDGFSIVQLASSRDMKTWNRLGGRKPFIETSPLSSGALDLTFIKSVSCPVEMGDELWFYYLGVNYRVAPKDVNNVGGICRAVLRRDGFISLDAGDKEGIVTTQRFILPAGKLFANVDAPDGWLKAEVIDAQGKVVATSEPIQGNLPRGEILWKEGSLDTIRDWVVSLRFTLKNARLYSWWLQPR